MIFHSIPFHSASRSLFILLLGFAAACSSPQLDEQPHPQEKKKVKTQPYRADFSAVSVAGNRLVFEDYENFLAVSYELGNMRSPERRAWEQAQGISSLMSHYEDFDASIEENTPPNQRVYAERLHQYRQAVRFDPADSSTTLNVFLWHMAMALNQDGLVQIKDHLVYIDHERTIYMPLTAENRLAEVLQMTQSDEAAGVYIDWIDHQDASATRTVCSSGLQYPVPVNVVPGQVQSSVKTIYSATRTRHKNNNTSKPLKYRSNLSVKVVQWTYFGNAFIEIYFDIKNERRCAFGAWCNYDTRVDVSGSADLTSNEFRNFLGQACAAGTSGCLATDFQVNGYSETMNGYTHHWIRSVISPFSSSPYQAPVIDFDHYWTETCVNWDFVVQTSLGTLTFNM